MAERNEGLWEREVDLLSYYPGFLKDILEFKRICETEAKEFYRLYENSDRIWADGFITSASLQGIKRWEGLLGMKPYPGDSLEDRRSSVLIRWNQQLPYTLLRLRERLDTSVGRGQYEILVHYQEYKLELLVDDQVYRTLCGLREMAGKMIPANLLFIFVGRYPMKFLIQVGADLGMKIATEFYPRYNLAYHLWEGAHTLDGGKSLNGYDADEQVDFYPVAQAISMDVLADVNFSPILRGMADVRCESVADVEYTVMAEAEADAGLSNVIGVSGGADAMPEEAALIIIWQGTAVKIGYGDITGVQADVSGTADIGGNQLLRGTADVFCAGNAGMEIRAETGQQAAMDGNCIYYRGEASAAPKVIGMGIARMTFPVAADYRNDLTVEKNLRYLEGMGVLAGTSLLNADIFNYKL